MFKDHLCLHLRAHAASSGSVQVSVLARSRRLYPAPHYRRRGLLTAAKNFGRKISRNAWEAGERERSASRSIPTRRVMAGRSGLTRIGYSSLGGKAAAGTIEIPSPLATKSNSDRNWLVMMLWSRTTPLWLAKRSIVRLRPELVGIEIIGSAAISRMFSVADFLRRCNFGSTT